MMTQKTSLPDQILNQNRNQNQNAFIKLNQFYCKIFGLSYRPLLAVLFPALASSPFSVEKVPSCNSGTLLYIFRVGLGPKLKGKIEEKTFFLRKVITWKVVICRLLARFYIWSLSASGSTKIWISQLRSDGHLLFQSVVSLIVKWGVPSRWLFHPISAWGSIATTTMNTLLYFSTQVQTGWAHESWWSIRDGRIDGPLKIVQTVNFRLDQVLKEQKLKISCLGLCLGLIGGISTRWVQSKSSKYDTSDPNPYDATTEETNTDDLTSMWFELDLDLTRGLIFSCLTF